MHAQDRHNLLAMFAHAPMGIALLREPDHRLDYWNDLFAEFFPGAQAGGAVATGLPALATQQVLGQLDSLYRTGEAYQGPVVPLATSDVPRYVTFTYQAYREQGQIVGVALFVQDVTAQEMARQRAEEASQQLRRHQALLDQVLGQAPAALATFSGPRHRFSFFNAQYQQLSGHRSVLGAPLAEVLPEADAQGFLALLDQVYRTGEPYVGTEVPVQRPQANGETATHYVDFRCQPLRDQATGQTQGILVFAVEVTAQVLARRQAATLQAELLAATQAQGRARETFYQVFAHTPAAISIQRGPAHRYEYVNAAYQQYFPGRELLGKTAMEAIPETDTNGLLALLDHVYQTGETYYGYEVPVPLTQPDGSVRVEYVTFTYQAFREQGEIVGISTFAYDVAELMRARHAREQQQQLLDTVFEQAPAGIWMVRGPEYVFEFINPAMAQIIGRTTEEALGRPYFEVLPELAGQGLPKLFGQAWELGEPVFIEELPVRLFRHGTHEQGYFTFVFQPLRDEQGQVSRMACVAQEVTTQVLARQQVQHLNEQMSATNQALASANDRLTRINADLDTFVYTAAHDLRAPIANLQGLVDALRQELLAEPIAEATVAHIFKLLDASIQRFYTTIGHLTDIIKAHQPGPRQREPIAIARLVEDVQLDLAPLLHEAGATLHVDTSACPLVEGSPKDLRSIVYNLVSNAVKYRAAARPPQVQVHTACDEQWVELRVQDNGLGLSPSQQEKLFGLFQRLHDHVEGSGVGLYSIKKLVDNAGGTITVASELGVGSTFTVRLPA